MEITYEVYLSENDNVFDDPNALCLRDLSQEEAHYITEIALRNDLDIVIRPLVKAEGV